MHLALGDVVKQISSAIKTTAKSGAECDRIQIKDKKGNVGWTTLHSKFLEEFVFVAPPGPPADTDDVPM